MNLILIIINIGCGTANYASYLSQYIGKVTGIEYNSGMLEQAKKKTANIPNINLIQGDAANIPLPDGYCHAVICTQVKTIHLKLETYVIEVTSGRLLCYK